MDYEDFGASKKGLNPKRKINGNMDLLKKFRYNFHYWLKNCYQPPGEGGEEPPKQDIYQTQAATNQAAS